MTTKLICRYCGYKFIPKTKVPDRCPYCSTVGTIRRQDTAGSLLDDVK